MAWKRSLLSMLLLAAAPLSAQDTAQPTTSVEAAPVVQNILVLDYEALFSSSQFGQRVATAIQEQGRALIEENSRIESELTAEELLLTAQRDELAPEEFSALADAFDEKVQRLRSEQDAKARAVGQTRDAELERFRQLVNPIIARVMQDNSAAVVLDRNQTIVWADAIDITDNVLDQVDRALGAGPQTTPSPTEPQIDSDTASD